MLLNLKPLTFIAGLLLLLSLASGSASADTAAKRADQVLETDDVDYDVVWLRVLSASSGTSCNDTNNTANTSGNATSNCTAVATSTTTTTTTITTTIAAASTSSGSNAASPSSTGDDGELGVWFFLFFSLLGVLVVIGCACSIYSCQTNYCSELYKWHERWLRRTSTRVGPDDGSGLYGGSGGGGGARGQVDTRPVEQQSIHSGEDFNFEAFFFSGTSADEERQKRKKGSGDEDGDDERVELQNFSNAGFDEDFDMRRDDDSETR
mmetsp:Transcript_7228/g.17519  ORF Transcript_7228/g.17519 Transcript_7228/m.17519 type:complete len:265 (+) Transcript_7228:333-1127(+)